jgi:predicted nuclease of restriction endonuclease-like (RecB) superfamily
MKELTPFDTLHTSAREVILNARQNAYRSINVNMTLSYWDLGKLIFEEEQQGKERAEYGKYLIVNLAEKLTNEFGRGYGQTNLRNFRQFFVCYPIRYALRSELAWTHYRLLMRIENVQKRAFYEDETIKSAWDTRSLERQITVFYYERLLNSNSNHHKGLREEADEKITILSPSDLLKDPLVLDFLKVNPNHRLYESDLEQALMNHLQQFILELGRGFAFVARQKYVPLEGEEAFIDLVFYNYILKCFVLIDLKMGKLTHSDVGQMDMYVRVYEDKFKIVGDNPTVGIILCSEKSEAIIKYSVLNESKQLFATKYLLYLPTEAELKAELERGRHFLEMNINDKNE